MPVVKDPSGLRYIITTPAGEFAVTADFREAYNDLFRGWNALEKQTNYVMPRRLARATAARARFDNAVRL